MIEQITFSDANRDFGTHDGSCCDSCMDDRDAGYGADIGTMCCCRALKSAYAGTLTEPDVPTPAMEHAYNRGLTDPDPDAFIVGDDGSPEWSEYWRGVRDRPGQ